jgi:N,N'-diacetyllegionaminate synthase
MEHKTVIIAEAGVNHNGDLQIAKNLVNVAADSGADYIKFQTFKAKNLLLKNTKKTKYQIKNTGSKESQFDLIKKLELSKGMHEELISYCSLKNIKFFSTAFDKESLKMLIDLGQKIIKIPSGEITNLPFLKYVGSLNKEVIMSTGMSNIKEIRNALDILEKSGTNKKKITVLHCNTEYPTPKKDVNLNAMSTIRKKFKLNVGYSDHTNGIEIPIAAVALGAKVIEKHFTLSRKMAGPDHKSSLEPPELLEMVKSIRNIEIAMGNGKKIASPSEIKNMNLARRSIVASKSIKKGDLFSENNLDVKRPGNGLSPMYWDKLIGTHSPKNFKKDQKIKL